MVKTAIQIAAEIYAKHGMVLADDLTHYLKFGYVFVTPDRMLLARGISVEDGPDSWLSRPDSGDCWYVKMAVGENCIPWFMQMAPSPKPYVAWKRDFYNDNEKLHVYPWNRLLTKVSK